MGDKCGDNMCYYMVLLSDPSRAGVISAEHLALKNSELSTNTGIYYSLRGMIKCFIYIHVVPQ